MYKRKFVMTFSIRKKYVICNILKQWDNKQISVCFYLSHIKIDMNKENNNNNSNNKKTL